MEETSTNILIIIIIIIIIIVVYYETYYKTSYFGSGPEIFSIDTTIDNHHLEPIYNKIKLESYYN